jgi:hypothetical protein
VSVTLPVITASTTCASNEGVLLGQSEYAALVSSVAGAVTTSNAASSVVAAGLTVVTTPYEAQPDDYAAMTAIFAVVLTAAAIIWGVKRILALFRMRPES